VTHQATATRNRRLTRRRSPKGGTRVVCRKGTFGLGSDLSVSVLDLSESGIRLIVREPLREKEMIELNLMGPGQGRSFRSFASVMWCVPTADGSYCVGARFDTSLRYKDLQFLVSNGS
jgi:hypothetical protein